MSKPAVSLVVLNFNNAQETIRCLGSLVILDQSKVNLDVIVVDNASVDDSLSDIKKHFPEFTYLISKSNLGYAGGNNLGIKYALKNKSDYIFVVNNDVRFVHRQTLNNLINTDLDITSPMIRYRHGKDVSFDRGGFVDYIFGRNSHHLHRKPDYLSGVSLFIRSAVFKKSLFFDDRYFLYYEDADFCLRSKKLGFTLGICDQTFVDHSLSASTNKLGKQKLRILASSHRRFILTHLPILTLPLALLYNLYLVIKSR